MSRRLNETPDSNQAGGHETPDLKAANPRWLVSKNVGRCGCRENRRKDNLNHLPALRFGVQFDMVRAAQPHHSQRLGIIGMMGVHSGVAAKARLLYELTLANGIANREARLNLWTLSRIRPSSRRRLCAPSSHIWLGVVTSAVGAVVWPGHLG